MLIDMKRWARKQKKKKESLKRIYSTQLATLKRLWLFIQ